MSGSVLCQNVCLISWMFCNIMYYIWYCFPYLNCIVPSQVTGIVVSKVVSSGKPALRVNWTTPQSDMAISQYQVEYKKTGITFWRAFSPISLGSTTSTLLEALDTGTTYQVRIRAVSAAGNGTWSRVQSETTYLSESSTCNGSYWFW